MEASPYIDHIPRVLIYSHISVRDGAAILRTIAQTLQKNDITIDHLVISTYEERLDGSVDSGRLSTNEPMTCFTNYIQERSTESDNKPFTEELQRNYKRAWIEYQPNTEISVEPTVEGALNVARAADRGAGICTLITGSLYLVGSALRLLDPI